ncbi:hypothetical protein M0804_007009 [Polistes exclamans]|nr:hypothetical protein M0804_007009 [Polistes exclamans]
MMVVVVVVESPTPRRQEKSSEIRIPLVATIGFYLTKPPHEPIASSEGQYCARHDLFTGVIAYFRSSVPRSSFPRLEFPSCYNDDDDDDDDDDDVDDDDGNNNNNNSNNDNRDKPLRRSADNNAYEVIRTLLEYL